jgi:hypothetical protein
LCTSKRRKTFRGRISYSIFRFSPFRLEQLPKRFPDKDRAGDRFGEIGEISAKTPDKKKQDFIRAAVKSVCGVENIIFWRAEKLLKFFRSSSAKKNINQCQKA